MSRRRVGAPRSDRVESVASATTHHSSAASPVTPVVHPRTDERTSVKTLLMVGAGVMGRGYVDAARRMGVRVVLIDLPPRRAIYGEIVDEFQDCPDPAEETWAAVALDVAAECRPTAALAFSEPQVLAAAWVQQAH